LYTRGSNVRNVKRFWLLTDGKCLLNLHLISLRISVHSIVTECKVELNEEMHTNIFVTSTVHASCNSHPRNKMHLDMNMWKILHVLIPKAWYDIK
jgi:hypothetical protein